MRHLLNTDNFSKSEVEKILSKVPEMEKLHKEGVTKLPLSGKVIACVFFEPSTRTRLSFETASLRLGASIISVEDAKENSSAQKGETIEDTARTLSCYADLIVMRHYEKGAVERASKVATKPVINAGDGGNQHPSQGFLDLYTIQKEHGRLENLSVAFVGDVLNSRTLHSLVPLLKLFSGNKFYFISPKELELPREFIKELQAGGVVFEELRSLEEKLPELDILYMTRVQKERFVSPEDYEKVKDLFIFKKDHLKMMKTEARVMHALPRVNEIESEVDADPRAAYFRQAQNGLYVRMALLCDVLGL